MMILVDLIRRLNERLYEKREIRRSAMGKDDHLMTIFLIGCEGRFLSLFSNSHIEGDISWNGKGCGSHIF
jgi:hypothetical protein